MATLITRVNGRKITSGMNRHEADNYGRAIGDFRTPWDIFSFRTVTPNNRGYKPFRNLDALQFAIEREIEWAIHADKNTGIPPIPHVQRNSIAQIVVPDFPRGE